MLQAHKFINYSFICGTGDRTRTDMRFLSVDFESTASNQISPRRHNNILYSYI